MTPTTASPTLSPDIAAALEGLRDIHLPEPVSWWPLAAGWWVLAGLMVAATLAAIAVRALRRRTIRSRALRELDALRRDTDASTAKTAEAVEILIRRIVLQRADKANLHAAHGAEWHAHLSEGPGAIAPEIAAYIAAAPYANDAANENAPADRHTLLASAETWIRRHA